MRGLMSSTLGDSLGCNGNEWNNWSNNVDCWGDKRFIADDVIVGDEQLIDDEFDGVADLAASDRRFTADDVDVGDNDSDSSSVLIEWRW